MACSIDNAYDKIREKPALALSIASTPLGALAFIFFIFTSMEGVKSLTESDSIFAIFTESAKSIRNLFAPLLNRSVREARQSKDFTGREILIFLVSLAVVAGLLIGLATDNVNWLSVLVAVLVGFILVAIVVRRGAPSWLRAVNGGAILGASIGIFVWLVRQADIWTTKKLFIDVLFVATFVYIILAGLALWNNYLLPTATNKILFR